MKKFIAILCLFAIAVCLMSGCFDEDKEETGPSTPKATNASLPAQTKSSDPASTDAPVPSESQAPAADGEYPEEIHLESAEYTGEGSGKDALFRVTVVLSPEAVRKGLSLGDIWARLGAAPTTDMWDGIQTYDGQGEEIALPNGGKRIIWKTRIYFPRAEDGSLQLPDGTELHIGANAAGQDANGQWQEGAITNILKIKLGK